MENHQLESYSRRAQVDIWREIANARYDPGPTQQISDHLNFIEESAKKLDASGFIWTRESILGILFQNGLPFQFPNSFNRTNEILDERIQLSGSTALSASEVREVIEAEDLRIKSPTLSFMDLPVELLSKIMHNVVKPDAIDDEKKLRLYLLRPLTLINRKFLGICIPMLWKNLILPGGWKVPANKLVPMAITKYGQYVESVSVKLAIDCFSDLDDQLYDSDFGSSDDDRYGPYKYCDPLDKYKKVTGKNQRIRERLSDDEKNVSIDTLKSVLEHCPNLQALKVRSPDFIADEDDDMYFNEGMTRLIEVIGPSVSKLTKLRRLTWGNMDCPEFPLDAFVQLIDRMPLLESLSICNLAGESCIEDLTSHISQLQHLCDLRLEATVLDASWCLHSWNQKLKTLELVDCYLAPSVAHRFIHLFASTLTGLKLSKIVWESEGPGPDISLQSYLLPALTDLYIENPDGDFLTKFDGCEDVRRFTCSEPSEGNWQSLYGLLLTNKWPRRERVRVKSNSKRLHPRVKTYVDQMMELSHKRGFVFDKCL